MSAAVRRVAVIAEAVGHELSPRTREALALGRTLAGADAQGAEVWAVLPAGNAALADEAIAYGADFAYHVASPLQAAYQPEPYADLAEQVCRELEPWLTLLPDSPLGYDLAPRLAFRLGLVWAAGCVETHLAGAALVLTRLAHGGRQVLEQAASPPLLLTLYGRCVEPLDRDATRTGQIRHLVMAPAAGRQELRHLLHVGHEERRTKAEYLCLNPYCHRPRWNRLCSELRMDCPLRKQPGE